MTENLKKIYSNGNRVFLWELLKLLLVPLITWAFMYYGSFVKLETQFNMFCEQNKEFKQEVKSHMGDRAIHKF